MLDSTNDLLGDFINAVAADVMTFSSRQTYETLLQDTSQLSQLSTYPILASRMEQTGTKLLKVVYRGYSTSHQLQDMHDAAIIKRTKLRLESDAALGEQEKRALELKGKQERAEQEQQLEEQASQPQAVARRAAAAARTRGVRCRARAEAPPPARGGRAARQAAGDGRRPDALPVRRHPGAARP